MVWLALWKEKHEKHFDEVMRGYQIINISSQTESFGTAANKVEAI